MKNIFSEKIWAWVVLRDGVYLPTGHWAQRIFGLVVFLRDADIAKDFKSNEGWCLALYRSDEELKSGLPVAIIPGCSVRALFIAQNGADAKVIDDPWTDLRIATW